VDPIEVIDAYGADALRFNIITGNSPGNDMRFYPERCEAMRNFANKIWNASRFVIMNLTIEQSALPEKLELEDRWIVSKLNTLISEVGDNMDKYELGIAASKIYDFIWDSYCDWYIELTKPRLNGDDAAAKLGAQQVLLYVLIETLKLLHPFMPFITEEIWQALPHEGTTQTANPKGLEFLPKVNSNEGRALMVEKYPVYSEQLAFPEDEANFESIMAAVRAVRARRAEMNVPPSKKPHLVIVTNKQAVFEAGRVYLSKLAYAGELSITTVPPEGADGMVSVVTNDAKLYMPLSELVDLDKERERVTKELKKAQDDLGKLEAKLNNPGFVSKAPEAVVSAERDRVEKLNALIGNLTESLKALG
jgi:valyl-tRNA synthetase